MATPEPLLPEQLTLEEHGAVRFDRAAFSLLPMLDAIADGIGEVRGGRRIKNMADAHHILQRDGPLARSIGLDPSAQPVRAILFDKSPDANWSLGWHQDRVIAVDERRQVAGYQSWTIKSGLAHVQPPFEIINRMLTVRIHLDDVPSSNAPLLIAPGSHRFGPIAEAAIPNIIRTCGSLACTARSGDVWLYRTAILHASRPSSGHRRRRVVQVDYSSDTLDGSLVWAGI